jgi:hypothetical protein
MGINFMLFFTSTGDLKSFYISYLTPQQYGGCILVDLSPILIILGIIIIPFVIVVFKNALRKNLWILRILLLVVGIPLLYLAGSLLYMEIQFNVSQVPSYACSQHLTHILINIASLGVEMLLFGLLLRQRPIEEHPKTALK